MQRHILLPVTISAVLSAIINLPASVPAADPLADIKPVSFAADDWPWWRGPRGNGIAADNQNPPTSWSETENIVWSAPVPGRGHGSPTVVGDQVLLATADEQADQQLVICYDRATGDVSWKTVVHKGNLQPVGRKPNQKASLASSTVACDGDRLYINFFNDSAIYTTALDRAGKILWQTKITDYVVHQGYGSSPTFYGDDVIVTADNKGGGAVVSLNRLTGDINWKHSRPRLPNYASPVVVNVAEKDQLILIGCDLVTSLNPKTGVQLWEIEGATTECVTSTVTDGHSIFTSGGYPDNHISAVAADGSGKVVWRNTLRAYVPSLLIKDGYLYATLDGGIATCIRSDTGEEMWKGRLSGTFSSSPVMVGELIYATNEEGKTFIFRATPEGFEVVATNQLHESVFATPAICGSRIYTRVAKVTDGNRQEMLYCIGE
jgi:outer membrane protein assembly factor BamB